MVNEHGSYIISDGNFIGHSWNFIYIYSIKHTVLFKSFIFLLCVCVFDRCWKSRDKVFYRIIEYIRQKWTDGEEKLTTAHKALLLGTLRFIWKICSPKTLIWLLIFFVQTWCRLSIWSIKNFYTLFFKRVDLFIYLFI